MTGKADIYLEHVLNHHQNERIQVCVYYSGDWKQAADTVVAEGGEVLTYQGGYPHDPNEIKRCHYMECNVPCRSIPDLLSRSQIVATRVNLVQRHEGGGFDWARTTRMMNEADAGSLDLRLEFVERRGGRAIRGRIVGIRNMTQSLQSQ